ncbi:MAG TPA: ABC-2 family transporter protein [Clostridia bacterium]|nr:ABC-2 family transporter protein [Clostridia bacterium]
MRLYMEFIKNAFLSSIAYRMDTFLHMLGKLLALFVQISIWYALFKGSSEVGSNMGTVTISEMVSYTMISTFISIFVQNSCISLIDHKINTGEIGMDLIKPMNFKLYLLSMMGGNIIFRIIFEIIPLLAIGIPVFGLMIPTWLHFLLFLIALINGAAVFFLLSYIFGLTGFWYISVWHFDRFLFSTTRLFSGAFIPLWFFPDVLNKVSSYLPFKSIYFVPITIYLEKVGTADALWLILQQLVWIGVLTIVEKAMWKNGIKKLVVQGG